MSMPKGYSSQEKDDRLSAEFTTVSKAGEKKIALDVRDTGPVSEVVADAVEAGSTDSVIVATAHVARVGDRIRFTSGTEIGTEVGVDSVIDANSFSLDFTLATTPAPADTFAILRPTSLTLSATGGFSSINTFVRDGSNQVVTEDTGTPANNRPLPVKITGLDGDVVINSSNLNLAVQLDHASANPDSTRIGDGVETVAVNASNEMQVADDTARTSLGTIAGDTTSLDTKVPAQGGAVIAASLPVNIASDQTVPVSAASLPLPTGAATEATLVTIDADTGSISTNTSVIAGDTTSLDTKVPAQGTAVIAASLPVNIASDQTVPVSAAALPLPSGAATEATLATIDADTSLLAGTVVGSELQVDVVTSALPAGAATEATLLTIDADTSNISTKIDNIEGTVNGTTLRVDVAVALPTGANTIGAVNLNLLDVVDFMDTPLVDAGSTAIPATGSYLTVVGGGGLVAGVSKIQVFDTTGEFWGIYSDPAGSPVLQAVVGPGSNETVEVSLPAATIIGLSSLTATAITSGSVAINFMG